MCPSAGLRHARTARTQRTHAQPSAAYPLPGFARRGQLRATWTGRYSWRRSRTRLYSLVGAKMCSLLQKSCEKFGSFGKKHYLCGMDQEKWVITGVNVLTKLREELSRPMSHDDAETRLARELENRRYQRYATHRRLRVEKCLPVQLSIKFEDNGE